MSQGVGLSVANQPEANLENWQMTVHVHARGKTVFKKTFTTFPLVFGRGEQCHIPLAFSFVSRNHGVLTVEDGQITVKDLGSVHRLSLVAGGASKIDQIELGVNGRFWVAALQFDVQLESLVQKAPDKKPEARLVSLKPENGVLRESKNRIPTSSPLPRDPNETLVADGFAARSSHPNAAQVSGRHPNLAAAQPLNEPAVRKSIQEKARIDRAVEYRNLFLGPLANFDFRLDTELQATKRAPWALQAAISWGEHLFDIRNYIPGDRINISAKLYDEICLPVLKRKMSFGKFGPKGGEFQIPKNMGWDLLRGGQPITAHKLIEENRLTERKDRFFFTLKKNEVLTLHFTADLKAHYRYICRPRPDFPRSWIENKEEFKKAAQISFAVHIVLCLFCLFSVPKSTAPVVENVPPRFARLLVEPPAAPIILPEPIPTPTPTPTPVVEKPPEPIVKPPLPLPKPKPQKVAKAQPIPKLTKQPVKVPQQAQKEEPAAATGPVSELPVQAEPSPAEREASALADMLNSAPSPGAQGLPTDIKVAKSGGSAAAGIKVGGLAGALPSNGPPIASGFGKNPGALAHAGQGGLAQTSGNKAGRRAVKAVLAEPSAIPPNEQGLSQDELNLIIAKYVSQIQRCYERSLFDTPTLVGRIEYEWTIATAGTVSDSHVKRSEMANADSLNGCVLKVINSMKFPQAKNGLSTLASVGFPFGK